MNNAEVMLKFVGLFKLLIIFCFVVSKQFIESVV